MKGYWNRPDATAAAMDRDGWFRTGDLARVDADGYFFIVDRSKNMIVRDGYNVYPREVEEVLYEHPAVREAAVVGVPDDVLGEEVGAAISLAAGIEADAVAIRDFVKDRVAAEWRCGSRSSGKPPSVKDVLDVLEHFGSGLAAADARYQAAPAPVAVATLMGGRLQSVRRVLGLDGLLGCAVSRQRCPSGH